jgi:hypothetical protein
MRTSEPETATTAVMGAHATKGNDTEGPVRLLARNCDHASDRQSGPTVIEPFSRVRCCLSLGVSPALRSPPLERMLDLPR